MRKRILSVLLVLSIFVQLFMGVTVYGASFSGGTGRVGNPYVITTEAQLSDIRNNLSSHFILANDIVVDNWTPIGTSTAATHFTGNLDGAGHTITVSYISSTTYSGLFGYTNGATIKNLNLKAGKDATNVYASSSYAGSFVGYAKGTLVLENCTSNLTISGKNYTGGMVGYGEDTRITSAKYSGNVNGSSYVGGIIGKMVVASASQSIPFIKKSSVTGNVTGGSSSIQTKIGGIIGELTGNVSECFSTGSVTGSGYVGGISGSLLVGNKIGANVTNCYATGDITSTSAVSGTGHTGGIVGNSSANSSANHNISNNYSSGKIYNAYEYTGGIIGYNGTSTGTTYSRTENNVAFNPEVRQKNSDKTSIGRVSGTSAGVSSNYSYATKVFYDTGTELATPESPQNGSSITPNEEFFTSIGFKEPIWGYDYSISEYPLLKWAMPDAVGVSLSADDFIEGNNLSENENFNLVAILSSTNDTVTSWTSSHPELASVNQTDENTAKIEWFSSPREDSEVTITVTTKLGATETFKFLVSGAITPVLKDLSIGLEVGESCRVSGLIGLTSEIDDISLADATTITWSSSDTNIASVLNGKVTANSLGTVKITGTTENGGKASIYVSVQPPPPVLAEEIILSQTTLSLEAGSKYVQVNASVLPSNTTDKTIVWSSDNENIVTVGATGKVYPLEPGIATITAKASNGVVAVIDVEVTDEIFPVTSVLVETTSSALIEAGETLQLSAIVLPENATNKTVTWECSPTGIVSIDEAGLVTGIVPGTAQITAIASGVHSTPISVTVNSHESVMLADWRKTTKQDATTLNFNALFGASIGANKDAAFISGIDVKNPVLNGIIMKATAWNKSTDTTPKAWQATVPAAGYTSFLVSFEQRADDISPNDFVLQYSTDGTSWVDVHSYSIRKPDQLATAFTTFSDIQLSTGQVSDKLYVRWKNVSTENFATGSLLAGGASYLRNVTIVGQR